MQVSGPRKCVRVQRLCGRFSETKFCLLWMPGWGRGGGVLPYKRLTGKCHWMVRIFTTAIIDKSLGTRLHFWGVFQCTQSNPSPYPTNNVGRVYPEFLPSFSFVYGEGGGGGERNARKFRKGCTVLRGNREMTEKYEYWSTVPRTFVRDCRLTMMGSNFQ